MRCTRSRPPSGRRPKRSENHVNQTRKPDMLPQQPPPAMSPFTLAMLLTQSVFSVHTEIDLPADLESWRRRCWQEVALAGPTDCGMLACAWLLGGPGPCGPLCSSLCSWAREFLPQTRSGRERSGGERRRSGAAATPPLRRSRCGWPVVAPRRRATPPAAAAKGRSAPDSRRCPKLKPAPIRAQITVFAGGKPAGHWPVLRRRSLKRRSGGTRAMEHVHFRRPARGARPRSAGGKNDHHGSCLDWEPTMSMPPQRARPPPEGARGGGQDQRRRRMSAIAHAPLRPEAEDVEILSRGGGKAQHERHAAAVGVVVRVSASEATWDQEPQDRSTAAPAARCGGRACIRMFRAERARRRWCRSPRRRPT